MLFRTVALCFFCLSAFFGCSHNSCIWSDAEKRYVWTCYDDGNVNNDYSKGYILENNTDKDFLPPNMSLIKSEQVSADSRAYHDLIFAYLSACKLRKITFENLDLYLNLVEKMRPKNLQQLLSDDDVWILHFIYNVVLVNYFGLEERLPLSFCVEAKEWFFSHSKFRKTPKNLPNFINRDIERLK